MRPSPAGMGFASESASHSNRSLGLPPGCNVESPVSRLHHRKWEKPLLNAHASSPLQATYDLMEALAALTDDMRTALRKHDFDSVEKLSDKNSELRAQLASSQAKLAQYRVETREEVEVVRQLREFTTKVAEGDRLFRLWKQDLVTYKLFGVKEIRNAVMNIQHLRKAKRVGSLRDAFKGQPAIVVAAGPSRDKQFPLLREYADRAVVFTMNRCVDAFIDQNIVPDFLLVTDSQPAIPKLHLARSNAQTMPTVVSRVSVDPAVFEYDANHRFCYTDGHDHENGVMKLLGLPSFDKLPGMSVAHSSLLMAYHLGCSPIILVGQDLAFTDNRYYAKSDQDDIKITLSDDGKIALTSESPREVEAGIQRGAATEVVDVPGYYGTPVSTSSGMAKMITYYECIMEEIGDAAHVINATEGGAHLKGMEHLPFKEALETYCTDHVDAQATIAEITAAIPAYKTADEARALLTGLEKRIGRVEQLAKSCLKLLPKAETSKKHVQKLKDLYAELGRTQEPLDHLFATVNILDKLDEHLEGVKELDTIASLKRDFRTIQRAAARLRPFPTEALERFRDN